MRASNTLLIFVIASATFVHAQWLPLSAIYESPVVALTNVSYSVTLSLKDRTGSMYISPAYLLATFNSLVVPISASPPNISVSFVPSGSGIFNLVVRRIIRGERFAVDNNCLLLADPSDQLATGAAYISCWQSTTKIWTSAQTLANPQTSAGSQFGQSVSLSGACGVVGAPFATVSVPREGAVYVYCKSASSDIWSLTATIASPSPVGDAQFGFSVSLFGSHLVVGSPVAGSGSGAAYIYEQTSTTSWTLRSSVTLAGTALQTGWAVSMASVCASVGIPGFANGRGAIAIYCRDQGGANVWGQVALREAPANVTTLRLGSSISIATPSARNGGAISIVNATTSSVEIDGNCVVAGDQRGAAIAYCRDAAIVDSWSIQLILSVIGTDFGTSVVMTSTGCIAVSAPATSSVSVYCKDSGGLGTFGLAQTLSPAGSVGQNVGALIAIARDSTPSLGTVLLMSAPKCAQFGANSGCVYFASGTITSATSALVAQSYLSLWEPDNIITVPIAVSTVSMLSPPNCLVQIVLPVLNSDTWIEKLPFTIVVQARDQLNNSISLTASDVVSIRSAVTSDQATVSTVQQAGTSLSTGFWTGVMSLRRWCETTFNVTINGIVVPNSLHLEASGGPDSWNTIVSVASLQVVVGSQMMLNVALRNASNMPIPAHLVAFVNLTYALAPPCPTCVLLPLLHTNDGSFSAVIGNVTHALTYRIQVFWTHSAGQTVMQQSPQVSVSAGTLHLSAESAYGNGLQQSLAGRVCRVYLRAEDVYGNLIPSPSVVGVVAEYRGSYGVIPISVSAATGCIVLSYTPVAPEVFKIVVQSPDLFTTVLNVVVQSLSGFNLSMSLPVGDALWQSRVASECVFYILPRDTAGRQLPAADETFPMSIMTLGPISAVAPVLLVQSDMIKVIYTPVQEGLLTFRVWRQIPGSHVDALEIAVSAWRPQVTRADNCTTDLGAILQPFAVVGVRYNITVIARDRFGAELLYGGDVVELNVAAANSSSTLTVNVIDGGLGRYFCFVTFESPGSYSAIALINGQVIPTSSLNITVNPFISQIKFDNSLDFVAVQFGAPLGFDSSIEGRHSSCDRIFVPTTRALLGDRPLCIWPSSSELHIYFGNGALLLPQQQLVFAVTLRSGMLSQVSGTVSSATTPASPIALIEGPELISACDSAIFSGILSSSQHTGGRSLMYTWGTTADSGLAADTSTSVPSFGAYYTIASGQVLRLATGLVGGTSYKIALQVTNFMGLSSITSTTLHVSSLPIPLVTIQGPKQQRHVRRAEALVLYADAHPSQCASDSLFRYEWLLVSGQVSLDLEQFSTSTLRIPPDRLPLGSAVTLQVYVTHMTDNTLVGRDTVTLRAASSDLRPLISGGSRTVRALVDLVVDGSDSYDPDSMDTLPSYQWTCAYLWNGAPTACSDAMSTIHLQANTRVVVSAASSILPGEYDIRLTMTKGPRNATSVARLVVVNAMIPMVGLSPVDGVVTTLSPLTLRASSDTDSMADLAWSVVGGSLQLDSNTLLSDVNHGVLVISPDALSFGQQYTFRLSANTDGSAYSGVAQTIVTIGHPPTGGRFDVVAIDEGLWFNAQAIGWTATAQPLEYWFAVELHADSETLLCMLTTPCSSASAKLFLPAAFAENSSSLRVRLFVRDAAGMIASAHVDVQVAQRPSFSDILDSVTRFRQAGDTKKLLQLLTAAMVMLNKDAPYLALPDRREYRLFAVQSVRDIVGSLRVASQESVDVLVTFCALATATGVESTRDLEVLVLQTVHEALLAHPSAEGVKAVAVVASNILRTISVSDRSDVSFASVEDVAAAISNVLNVLSDNSAGECRQHPTTLQTRVLTLSTMSLPFASIGARTFAINDTEVSVTTPVLSSLFAHVPPGCVVAHIAVLTENPYCYDRSAGNISSPIVRFGFRADGAEVQVVNTLEPISVTIPHFSIAQHRLMLGSMDGNAWTVTPQCVFYNASLGRFSDFGCVTQLRSDTSTTCACRHLTDFAIVFTSTALLNDAPSSSIELNFVPPLVGAVIVGIFVVAMLFAVFCHCCKCWKRCCGRKSREQALHDKMAPVPITLRAQFIGRMEISHEWIALFSVQRFDLYTLPMRLCAWAVSELCIVALPSVLLIVPTPLTVLPLPWLIFGTLSACAAAVVSMLCVRIFVSVAQYVHLAFVKRISMEHTEAAPTTPENSGTATVQQHQTRQTRLTRLARLRNSVIGAGLSSADSVARMEQGRVHGTPPLQPQDDVRSSLPNVAAETRSSFSGSKGTRSVTAFAYLFSAGCACGCMYAIVAFGMMLPHASTLEWLKTVLVGVGLHAFVVQPLFAFLLVLASTCAASATLQPEPRVASVPENSGASDALTLSETVVQRHVHQHVAYLGLRSLSLTRQSELFKGWSCDQRDMVSRVAQAFAEDYESAAESCMSGCETFGQFPEVHATLQCMLAMCLLAKGDVEHAEIAARAAYEAAHGCDNHLLLEHASVGYALVLLRHDYLVSVNVLASAVDAMLSTNGYSFSILRLLYDLLNVYSDVDVTKFTRYGEHLLPCVWTLGGERVEIASSISGVDASLWPLAFRRAADACTRFIADDAEMACLATWSLMHYAQFLNYADIEAAVGVQLVNAYLHANCLDKALEQAASTCKLAGTFSQPMLFESATMTMCDVCLATGDTDRALSVLRNALHIAKEAAATDLLQRICERIQIISPSSPEAMERQDSPPLFTQEFLPSRHVVPEQTQSPVETVQPPDIPQGHHHQPLFVFTPTASCLAAAAAYTDRPHTPIASPTVSPQQLPLSPPDSMRTIEPEPPLSAFVLKVTQRVGLVDSHEAVGRMAEQHDLQSEHAASPVPVFSEEANRLEEALLNALQSNDMHKVAGIVKRLTRELFSCDPVRLVDILAPTLSALEERNARHFGDGLQLFVMFCIARAFHHMGAVERAVAMLKSAIALPNGARQGGVAWMSAVQLAVELCIERGDSLTAKELLLQALPNVRSDAERSKLHELHLVLQQAHN